jgi:hypothetical protein
MVSRMLRCSRPRAGAEVTGAAGAGGTAAREVVLAMSDVFTTSPLYYEG